MNEELQQELAAMVRAFVESLGGAKDFALDQAPDVIQQLLTWSLTVSLMSFLGGIAALITSVILGRLYFATRSEDVSMAQTAYNEGQPWTRYGLRGDITSCEYDAVMSFGTRKSCALLVGAVILLISGMALLNLEWLQIWLAPKVYLIEYATKLI